MVYHTLYGNPQIVSHEGLRFLNFFKQPRTEKEIIEMCDGNPKNTIQEFASIFFLIEPGFDEKEFLQKQKARHLSVVNTRQTIDRMGLAISDFCNFGCAHCLHFQPSGNTNTILSVYQRPVKQLNMSWEIAKKCIDHYTALMRENGHTLCKVHFGNAEPLFNWLVIEKIIHYCEEMHDLTFEFTINTNLVLMTRDIAEAFKRYQIRIATSLDGTSRANDAIRLTKGGKGTFNRILEKFDLLEEIGYPLDGFSITVTNGNFDLIDIDIIDLAANRGMTSIAFDYDLISLVDIPLTSRIDKLIRFKKYANNKNIDFFGTWDSVFRNLTSESLLTGNHAFCAAAEGRALEFNVDGSIKICSHTTTPIGHIDNFNQMFQETGGLFKIVKDRFPGTDEYCLGCIIEGPCGGQCHVTREVTARAVGEKRQKLFADMCDFYRLVTEALAVEYIRSHNSAIGS
jgi:uncharacterized protein